MKRRFCTFFKYVILSFFLSACSSKSLHTSSSYNGKVHAFDSEQAFRQFLTDSFYEHLPFFEKTFSMGLKEPTLFLDLTDKDPFYSSVSVTYRQLKHYTKNMTELMNYYNRYYYSFNQIVDMERKYPSLSHYQKSLLERAKEIAKVPYQHSKQEQKILFELYTLHELGHLYYPYRSKPFYDPIYSRLFFGKKQYTLGAIRDEIYADTIALIVMKQKYGNDPVFLSTLNKFSKRRIVTSLRSAILFDSNYNLYPMYRDGMKKLFQLKLTTKEDIKEIAKQVDHWTLEVLYYLGLNGMDSDVDGYSKNIANNINNDINTCNGFSNESLKNACLDDFNISDSLLEMNRSGQSYEKIKQKILKLQSEIRYYQN